MAEVTVRVNISPALKSLINNNEKIAPRAIKKGMQNISKVAPKEVKKTITSMGLVRSGDLRKSIRGKVERNKAVVGSPLFYGHIIEGGAKPHRIKAKEAKGLAIPGTNGSIKEVYHPGVRAYKYLESTVDNMESTGEIDTLFSKGVTEAIKELS